MEPCTKEHEIEKLTTAIYGNGEPGIRTMLALIQQKMDTIEQKIDDMSPPGRWKWYVMAGSGLGILAVYGFKVLLG